MFSCNKQGDAEKTGSQKSKVEIIENESLFFDVVTEQTMIPVFSILNSDLQSCVNKLENELQKVNFYVGEVRELEFKLAHEIPQKTTIHLEEISLKNLLKIICLQYGCDYKIKNNMIIFYQDFEELNIRGNNEVYPIIEELEL